MKIFISHSTKNSEFGDALVNLLTGVGVRDSEIIFTSNDAYGIPTGKSIFDWLKNQIKEKPHVIYLLSPEYYQSIACLNEMGAAWIVENEHTIIFTPDFNVNGQEFQSGAVNPREIGFYINNEDRLLLFIDTLSQSFPITTNVAVKNQKVKALLRTVGLLQTQQKLKIEEKSIVPKTEDNSEKVQELKFTPRFPEMDNPIQEDKGVQNDSIYQRFLSDIMNQKLKDNELLLLNYINDTGRSKLCTGWQESFEISNIKEWEDINGLNSILSQTYGDTIRRFGIRKYIEISETTSSGNPKAVSIVSNIQDKLLDFPNEILTKIVEAVRNNLKQLPF